MKAPTSQDTPSESGAQVPPPAPTIPFVTFFASVKLTRAIHVKKDYPLDNLAGQPLVRPFPPGKAPAKAGDAGVSLMSPARFRPLPGETAPYRSRETVIDVGALMLDLEEDSKGERPAPPSLTEAVAWLDAKGLAGVVHTTWGHTPEHPRYRVAIVFTRPVTADEYDTVWSWAQVEWKGTLDTQARDASRCWYIPACPKERERYHRAFETTGALLDPIPILAAAPSPAQASAPQVPAPKPAPRSRSRNGRPPAPQEEAPPTAAPDDEECPSMKGYTHRDLAPGTKLTARRATGDLPPPTPGLSVEDGRVIVDPFALPPIGKKLPDRVFQRLARRVFCPFHEGKSGEASAFLGRVADHWALICGSCRTYYHAAPGVLAVFALNDRYTYVLSPGRVFDRERDGWIRLESFRPYGSAHREWANAKFDDFRERAEALHWGPEGTAPPRTLNLWNPERYVRPSGRPQAEPPPRMGVLLDTLANKDPELRRHLERWLAHLVQKPFERQVVLCLIGLPGTGKGFLNRALTALFGGRRYARTLSPRDLESDFITGMIARKLLVVVEEADSRSWRDKSNISEVLRHLTMDDVITVNEKNVPHYDLANYANWIINSNSKVPVLLEAHDRRYAIIRSTTLLKDTMNNAERDELAALLKDSVWLQHLADWLAGVDLTDYNAWVPWASAARDEAVEQSLSEAERWWTENFPPAGVWHSKILYALACPTLHPPPGYRAWRNAVPDDVRATKVRLNTLPGAQRKLLGVVGNPTVPVLIIPARDGQATALRIPERLLDAQMSDATVGGAAAVPAPAQKA